MTEHPNTAWPTLPASEWADTIEALHLWSHAS